LEESKDAISTAAAAGAVAPAAAAAVTTTTATAVAAAAAAAAAASVAPAEVASDSPLLSFLETYSDLLVGLVEKKMEELVALRGGVATV